MAIRKFKADDMITILKAGVKEFGVKAQGADALRELAEEREKSGLCLTVVESDKITACGGIDMMWKGVGEVWMMLACGDNKYPRDLYVNIRTELDKFIETGKLHRVQAHGRIGFDKAHILFKHLGFKAEGIAYKYTSDQADYISYAKVT